MSKIKVAVVGAAGYTGEQLVDVLIDHPDVELVYLADQVSSPKPVKGLLPSLSGRLDGYIEPLDNDVINERADIVFLPLPHRVSFKYAPIYLKQGKKVIDISADYRLKDPTIYKQYYGVDHIDVENLKLAVYGLPELFRDDIRDASLIANPGCYPTASTLALAPFVSKDIVENIIIDAKTGTSGGGRNSGLDAHLTGDLYAYRLFKHQHTPEIVQNLSTVAGRSISLLFTPHVAPVDRGIHATIYANLKKNITRPDALDILNEFYENEPFIKIFKEGVPHMKDVIKTNSCHIGFEINDKKIILLSCIDNLMKGAASQAVQNMNIITGTEETRGLKI